MRFFSCSNLTGRTLRGSATRSGFAHCSGAAYSGQKRESRKSIQRTPVILKIHSSTLLRNLRFNRLIALSLLLCLSSTGCRSFLASQGMKNYPVKAEPVIGLPSPNRYQQDFLHLKTLADDVFPLENRYFPPDRRA